jgi:hypothetical protein
MNNHIIDLRFSYNWNKRSRKGKESGKLDCLCFSTLRIDQSKYTVGWVYRVILEHKSKPNEVLGYAKAIVKNVFEKDKLTEGVALLDTGYDRAEVLKILAKMYPTSTDKTKMCFLVFKYMTDIEITEFSKQTQLKLDETVNTR